ncbi:SMI1/KNR4 family protein [Niabella drilacis]|uniref:SMI1 / KNR4 family (SUKH-1) n=1 Tax=Niabella drilacis (strain DSM 25811 / CCM 8410 / CCUG 62505 / LMG 26954 / E90) TaxID=1285928 RepID=A0A1G7ABE3_NIADE|nr:SMI1/KNR4 family protein [Niabella drilacis]SDE11365.1 SMI1 / KNR4 family (SUKH-1) [Niabella drilacis]
MNNKLRDYLMDFKPNKEGASQHTFEHLQHQNRFSLPQDYIDFMKAFNGGEGGIGENGWLYLFPAEALMDINKAYGILMEQIPGYFLFGKDAADTGYAFQKQTGAIYSFGLMSNFETNSMDFCGSNFSEFTEYLFNT